MFCAFCGCQIPEGGSFCPNCGKKVIDVEQNVAPEVKEETASKTEEVKEEVKEEAASKIEEVKEEVKEEAASKVEEVKEEVKEEAASKTEEVKKEVKNEVAVVQPTAEKTSGAKNANSGNAQNGQAADAKFNIKSILTPENIERFAPMVAFLPLVMFLVTGIVGAIVNFIPVFWIRTAIMMILKVLFCLVALGAEVGLFYVVVEKKDTERVWTWITPIIGVFAFIACICVFLHWGLVGFVFGLISFIMGLDFLARITIPNGQMDSKINVAEDFKTYKSFVDSYREKYPSTKELERRGIKDPENSYFDGSGLELLGLMIAAGLISAVTCGIATPWAICMVYKWRVNHTVINGKRLNFNGTGASLLGHWILWEILTVITCGIYGFFTYVAVRKWELSHTYIEGEVVYAGSKDSYFDGNSFEYAGYSILFALITLFTLTIGAPWGYCMIQKWDAKHQVVSGRRLEFSGSGLGFLGEFLLIELLTIITLGIYQPWGIVRMNKYIMRHTDFQYRQ